tara:strand:+ start:185 stop:676 length:492 start_codon:yes stop_codon:yes gene_type:complete
MKKTNKLVEIIKNAVRDVVREELKEALSEKSLTKENIAHGINLVDLQNAPKNPHEQGTQRKKKQDFTFSKDPVLNKILNETAAEKDEWPTLGKKTYNREDARAGLASMMGYGDLSQTTGKPSVEQMLPNDRKHVQVSDDMAEVLTKDYSALMKKVEEKKAAKK